MKASCVCLLFAILLMFVFPKGNEGSKRNHAKNDERKRREKFNEYDRDRDGFIDIQEFSFKGTNDGLGEQIDFIFENADGNRNGQISYAEFEVSPLGIVD